MISPEPKGVPGTWQRLLWLGFGLIKGRSPHSLQLKQSQPALTLTSSLLPPQSRMNLTFGTLLLTPIDPGLGQSSWCRPVRKKRVGVIWLSYTNPPLLLSGSSSHPWRPWSLWWQHLPLLFLEKWNLKRLRAFCQGCMAMTALCLFTSRRSRRPILFGVTRHTNTLIGCHFSFGFYKHIDGKCCCLVMHLSDLNIRVSE